MRAYIYSRVSTDEQATDNHYSLDNQQQKARDYIKRKGWRVADSRKDVASGKNADREGYQDLLKAIGTGRVDVIVVYRLDRLSRNVKDIYDFLDAIRIHDVAFVSLSEGFDTTTAMGRAMLGVAAVFAQLTREMIAENVKDGLMRRVQSGLYTGATGGPTGYIYDTSSRNLAVVPAEAECVREIFRLFVERKWGLEKIASFLNEQDSTTKNGKQWRQSQIRRIVSNPVYIGKVNWHDSVFDGRHEPIVDEETFSAAQSIIANRKPLPSRVHQSQHLLSGITTCGKCAKRLIAHYGPKKKDGSRYVFYRHGGEGLKGECRSFYRSAAKLEKVVLREITKAANSGVLSAMASEELHRQIETKAAPLRARLESISSEMAKIKDKFNSWADRLDRDLIDEDQFITQNSRLLERKRSLQEELAIIDRELVECENVEVSLEAAQAALRQFSEVWDNLEIEEQRELLRLLLDKLEVHKEHLLMKIVFLPEEVIPLK